MSSEIPSAASVVCTNVPVTKPAATQIPARIPAERLFAVTNKMSGPGANVRTTATSRNEIVVEMSIVPASDCAGLRTLHEDYRLAVAEQRDLPRR